jgi:hypothetical protein
MHNIYFDIKLIILSHISLKIILYNIRYTETIYDPFHVHEFLTNLKLIFRQQVNCQESHYCAAIMKKESYKHHAILLRRFTKLIKLYQ